MTDNAEERNIEWAIKVFRPLLKDLNISHLEKKDERRQILTADYKLFIRHSMDKCVIIVCRYNLYQDHHQGIFVWQYNEKEDFYALYIILNNNLFSPSKTQAIVRKAVSVHEYVHCVAAMLALSRLKTKKLIEILQSRMSKRFHALTIFDVGDIISDLRKSKKDKKLKPIDTFDDDHFRIEWEDFQASYAVLYRNLLLSYELFCEEGFFDTEKRNKFINYILNKKTIIRFC